MRLIVAYFSRKVYWFDYDRFNLDQLPKDNWLCFATSDKKPNTNKFKQFVKCGIQNNILEFKGHGKYGEELHDLFDQVMIDLELSENLNYIDIATTCHNDESYADAFWQCFFATTLPVRADLDDISIVCMDLNGKDRSVELKGIIDRFEKGWIPED